MKSYRYIGISFLNGKIQLAEIEHKRKLTVTALVEDDTTMDFSQLGAELSADHPQVETFVAELKSIIKKNKMSAENISFALPPDPVFINIIPLDPKMSGKELSQYLRWEVQQYFPDTPQKEFVVDSHGLPIEDTTAQQTFMVAVRRGMAMFLQQVVAGLKMKMNIIDIDQFSTEKTLITNYPEILEHDIVLFGLHTGGIDASLIHNGQMTDYRAFNLNGETDPSKTILEYIKYLKQKDNSNPEALLLHGVDIPRDLVKSLRASTGIKQTLAMNSFRKIKPSDKIQKSFLKESYRFAAAIGLALRTR
jgi:Tfp pilus assembly PilM family ATPase